MGHIVFVLGRVRAVLSALLVSTLPLSSCPKGKAEEKENDIR